jgi:hypothetical protein
MAQSFVLCEIKTISVLSTESVLAQDFRSRMKDKFRHVGA